MQVHKASTAPLARRDPARTRPLMHPVLPELAGGLEFVEASGFQTQLKRAQLLSVVHSGSKV